MQLTFYGKPKPMQRPRLYKNRVFNPSSKDINEMKRVFEKQISTPLDGALQMNIDFHMPIAESLPNKKKAERLNAPHMSRPDLDNLIKLVCDAGNGVLYHDDAQVVKLSATKYYGDTAKTVVTIHPLESGFHQPRCQLETLIEMF